MRKQRYRYLIIYLIAALSLSSCSLLVAAISPNYPPQTEVCEFFDKSDNILDFWLGIPDVKGIADMRVRIPAEYMSRLSQGFIIDMNRFDPETEERYVTQGGAHIRFRISDFAPYSEYRTPIGHKQNPKPFGTLVIQPTGHLNENLQQFANLSLEELDAILASQPQAKENDDYPSIIGRFGSTDIYFDYADNQITDLISCRRQRRPGERNYELGEFKSLTCIDFIPLGPIGFQLTYEKAHLGQRKEIRSKALEFIDCAFVERE